MAISTLMPPVPPGIIAGLLRGKRSRGPRDQALLFEQGRPAACAKSDSNLKINQQRTAILIIPECRAIASPDRRNT
jgi:hypothetical protein